MLAEDLLDPWSVLSHCVANLVVFALAIHEGVSIALASSKRASDSVIIGIMILYGIKTSIVEFSI